MPKFSLSHEINCNEATFWELFFDQEKTAKLFKEGLEFKDFRTVSQTETDDKIVRTTAAVPKMNMPAPVAKALGSSFGYSEEGTFDKATKVWRWKMTPTTLSEKVRTLGTLKLVPVGDSKVRREIEIDVEAKVFMVGGLIEEAFQKQITEGWNRSAELMNEWLAQGT